MPAPPPIPERFSTLPPPAARRGYNWRRLLPFVLVHVACLGALWTGARPIDWAVCIASYYIRTFAVMAGYHRYFAHRSFRTSRVFQFILAVLAQSSGQRGVLWWAAHHRNHHKFADLPWDAHSPVQSGFWYSHLGWIAERSSEATDHKRVQDLAKYPELRWLDRQWRLAVVALGTATYLALGWSGFFIGFCLSTVLVWHATFLVNSLTHVVGKRRFETPDASRNNWLIALVTLGEGWHNNHHHYMGSARQGFYWWELDVTHAVLRVLDRCGIIWDMRKVPASVLAEGRIRDAAAKRARSAPPTDAPPVPAASP